MTKVAIYSVPSESGITFRALSNGKRAQGATAGEALDALSNQLTKDESGTLVIVQNQRPDPYFNESQRQRLDHLMGRWRTARDRGESLPVEEQTELDGLVQAELKAATSRAAALADELER